MTKWAEWGGYEGAAHLRKSVRHGRADSAQLPRCQRIPVAQQDGSGGAGMEGGGGWDEGLGSHPQAGWHRASLRQAVPERLIREQAAEEMEPCAGSCVLQPYQRRGGGKEGAVALELLHAHAGCALLQPRRQLCGHACIKAT